MRSFHKACGSTDLSKVDIKIKKRHILLDKCNHCQRIIESYEINGDRILLNKAVSNIILGPQSDDVANMIIESCKK